MRKVPYAMDWTPEMEYTTLWGKPILSFTKKQLAAYVAFLCKRHLEILEEKNRQIRNIVNLRRPSIAADET